MRQTQSNKGSHGQNTQTFFNKNGNESAQSNNFTLGPQGGISSNEFTKDSFDQNQTLNKNEVNMMA